MGSHGAYELCLSFSLKHFYAICCCRSKFSTIVVNMKAYFLTHYTIFNYKFYQVKWLQNAENQSFFTPDANSLSSLAEFDTSPR